MILYLISISLGWFTNSLQTVLDNSESIIISSNDNLQISLSSDEVNWSNHIDIDNELSLIDVSSDGNTFICPNELDSNYNIIDDIDTFTILTNSSISNHNDYVYSINLSFKTNNKMDVFFGNNGLSESFLLPREDINGNNLNRVSYYSYSNPFSRDGISGAMRVAFYEVMDEYEIVLTNGDTFNQYVSSGVVINDCNHVNNQLVINFSDGSSININDNNSEIESLEKNNTNIYVLKNLWIPNPNYELYYVNNEAFYNVNGNREESYKYLKNENNNIVLSEFNVDDYLSFITVGNNVASNINDSYQNNSFKLLEFYDTLDFVIKKMVIRIWVEGTDRESNVACDCGKVKFALSFLGINKNDNITLFNSSGNVNLLDDNNKMVLYSNRDEVLYFYGHRDEDILGMEYTINGIDWFDYDNSVSIGDYNKIYVRMKETNICYHSNTIEIIISL